ncbi:IS3 family transposase, partial [Brevundimonas sp.]|uniref:IS3 family transposase n=1 Tax=Brevundimonas sp. TaxID=1871086 RepID=UPI002ABAADCD
QVSHSGFYDWAERQPSRRARTNQILKAHIQDSFHGSDRTYGSPRVWRDLQDWGCACSENRVARLMQQLGLKARGKRRRQPGDSGVRPEHAIAPNLLDRQLRLKAMPRLRFAGQVTGVEGYVESAAMGLLTGRLAAAERLGHALDAPPPETALGALVEHITGGHLEGSKFQPMNINYGLLPPLPAPKVDEAGVKIPMKERGRAKKRLMSLRAVEALNAWRGAA